MNHLGKKFIIKVLINSFRDFDQFAKKIAQDFKNYIKTNNSEYVDKLKSFLNEGFENYYEELNKNLQGEYLNQESKQNNIQKTINNNCKEIENLYNKVFILFIIYKIFFSISKLH
jgi:hypothetical protein